MADSEGVGVGSEGVGVGSVGVGVVCSDGIGGVVDSEGVSGC